MDWKKRFQRLVVNAEAHFDKLKSQLLLRVGGYDEVMILPYIGFGNKKSIYLKGRVLEDKKIKTAESSDSIWENLRASYKRMNSNELPYVKLKATFQGIEKEVLSDEEGYFTLLLTTETEFASENSWAEVSLELIEVKGNKQEQVDARGMVLIPSENVGFGIISDIDDTILQTKATEITKLIQLTFMRNARTRCSFKGVSAFYHALQKGKNEEQYNPIFYVSSSPWNLYDFLKDFCEIKNIPKGVFFLRDLGLSQDKFLQSSHSGHKSAHIHRIMAMYPQMSFVLIGDSGQKDPEIYLEAVRRYPHRILAIYIRDVSENEKDIRAEKVVSEAQDLGVAMLFFRDTLEAGQHAVAQGFISEVALTQIEQDQNYKEQTELDFPILEKWKRG